MFRHKTGKRHRQVKAERNVSSSVVREPENLFFGFTAALPQQNFRIFQRGRINRNKTGIAEDGSQFFQQQCPGDFLFRQKIPEAFEDSGLYNLRHVAIIPRPDFFFNTQRKYGRTAGG